MSIACYRMLSCLSDDIHFQNRSDGKVTAETFGKQQFKELAAAGMAQPFNWHAAARFARINWLLSKEISEQRERPRWSGTSFFGEWFAPEMQAYRSRPR